LVLLQAYGMGPNLLRILRNFWDSFQLVPRQSGYYGRPIPSKRGVTQGDPLSPTLFNIIVDAAVHELLSYPYFNSLKVMFYADDGYLASTDPYMVQAAVTMTKNLFEQMGLQMNASKTKVLLGEPLQPMHLMSDEAYHRRLTGEGQTYRE
jgi:Reverse transcriptase (RNA-dependent DNA polymerase)